MNELKWQRTQLLRIQAQQAAKQGKGKKPVPKVTEGGAKRVGPQKQIPKLSPSKPSSVAGGSAQKKPLGAANQAQQKKNLPNGTPKAPSKTPAGGKPPTVAKATPKPTGAAK
ncbi:MAG: hypothetical protein Q9218_003666 [Villophora microphyllina]